ncbi:MAG: hypothetical protein RLZZ299_2748, partial [Pseudomonadota bacterium]
MRLVILLAMACARGGAPDSAADAAGYAVRWSTQPSPVLAGAPSTFTLQVLDGAGDPVQDLTRTHARMVHTVFLAPDLRGFLHLHQEDTVPVDADDLRAARFSFPVTFPAAGPWRLAFDFAHRGAYRQVLDTIAVQGDPVASVPDDAPTARAEADGVVGELVFAQPPVAGVPASWTVWLAESTGAEVRDVVPWLDADAHAVMTPADLESVSHTHAWFPGMEGMAPGHPMPHLYDGPDIPFQSVFPSAGRWVVWTQVARADAPEV